ncbi:sugar phosphate isomerase/epimerase [bacterium]|nr:sugar phosphate isomerase/epimerase [bacterium]
MKRPLAFLAELGFTAMPAEQVVESILGAGFDTIEWTMAHLDTFVEPACAIACQQDFVTDPTGALERTLRAIDVAAARGVPTLNVVSGPNLWEDGAVARYDEQAWAGSLRALEAACDHAEGTGVDIALEPCWGTLTYDVETMSRALAEVPCKVNLDPSHLVMEDDDIPDAVRLWGDRIVHVHLKDAFGVPGIEGDDFLFCLLGEGKVPWPGFFEALDEVGYTGPLSVEFEAYRYLDQVLGGDPVRAAVLAMEQVRALVPGAAS